MDEDSSFKYDQLNEQEYLNNFFWHLSEKMGNEFSEYQFYIFSSKGNKLPRSRNLTSRNKVLIFISDELETKPIAIASNYLAIFKAYLPDDEHCAANKIYTFPLGVVNGFKSEPIKPIEDRSIGVYFVGNLNTNRISLFSALFNYPVWLLQILQNSLSATAFKKLVLILSKSFAIKKPFRTGKVEFTSGFKEGYDINTYSRFLRDSKIVLCPKGFHASETFRHYEALSAGCIVVSENLPDTGLYRDSPIIQVSCWEQGVRLAKELLDKPNDMAEIHCRTIEWWNKKMSASAASQYVHGVLESAKKNGQK